jgi:hypothetical protein
MPVRRRIPMPHAKAMGCSKRMAMYRYGEKRYLREIALFACLTDLLTSIFLQWSLWRGIEITAIALEVFIFSISLLLVWSLRMRLGLKAMVVFAFSVRLL